MELLKFFYVWVVTIIELILCAEIVVISVIGQWVFDEEKARDWGLRTLYALVWQTWHMGVITDDQLKELRKQIFEE